MSRRGLRAKWLAERAAGAGLGLAALTAQAYTETSGGYNVPVGVTEISREVFHLHMAIFWVCVVIGVIVFGAMIYSIIFHRRSKNPKPADFHESTTVEIIWTTIPFLILIAIAVPAAATLIKMEDTRNSDMSIKITGYQWKWHYDYLGENVSFFSTLSAESNKARQLNSGVDVNTVPNYLVDVDNPLVVPVGKKIRFLITSNDVIHAWWVPEIAVKKDAIPGYVNEVWTKIDQPGTYRGVCAELCGRDHGYMPIVLKAVTEDEYKSWLAQQKGETVAAAPAATATDVPADAPAAAPAAPAQQLAAAEAAPAAAKALSKDELMKQGEAVYKANCMACHQATGQGLPPNFPSLIGSPVIKGPADAQIKQVLVGKNLMPPFKQLSDADIAAVVTYTRNSWGNSGGVVQPAQVAAQR
ncbi:cytochrome c oxidase subunit 2 [Fontimonas thermophila]|uniref:Cytochrome c oxidase subunit 2 n=1 Tax=Fontimonas thermophila TaxID=1076937 RepID=A0A1I2JXJ0_9GAMM|nr:cytochrome c oxidase subunit II [Fontimonas thermophila]SFF59555.1 cytochrome c oxidase subunit 2 [Fontimonas thermophila]